MKKLHDYFPWLTDEQIEKLRRKLLLRTAQDFEEGECWREAAECWQRLGEAERAAGLYGRVGDWQAAGKVLLLAGQYEAAREVYEKWEQEAEEDVLLRVKALLGQAACEVLANEEEWVVPESYREARRLVESGLGEDTVINAQGWAAIAAYGALVGRFDLLHMGYERALSGLYLDRLGNRLPDRVDGDYAQRIAIGEAYLAAAMQYGDQLLVESIEERLAKWKIDPSARFASGQAQPAWMRFKQQIERHPFREGVHDVLHLTNEAQLEAWRELASIEENPEVDDYLRTLAPPDMAYIPAGMFIMGSADDDPDADDDEKPQHEVWLGGYYMNRYPITNAQYGAFMEAGGYQQADYWREAAALGWWEEGKYQGRYQNRSYSEPRYWHNERINQPQQPVVGISWHEALAYCRWAGMDLPTEAQWEKAAGWDADEKRMRRYPWGDEYDESKVLPISQKHSEVGEYCKGELNFYGLSDMTGLWQWCRSRYLPYPYQPNEQREGLEGEEDRVIRGYRDYRLKNLRCKSRVRDNPYDYGDDNVGFRPVWPYALVLNSES